MKDTIKNKAIPGEGIERISLLANLKEKESFKPGSVKEYLRNPWIVIYLGALLPKPSSDRPERYNVQKNTCKTTKSHLMLPLFFDLALSGVYPATSVTRSAVRFYRTISPLPFSRRYIFCGTFPQIALAGYYPTLFFCRARTFLLRGDYLVSFSKLHYEEKYWTKQGFWEHSQFNKYSRKTSLKISWAVYMYKK
jgi:hypothetical protein